MVNSSLQMDGSRPSLFDFAWPALVLAIFAFSIVSVTGLAWSWYGHLSSFAILWGVLFGLVLYAAVYFLSNRYLAHNTEMRRLYRQLTRLFGHLGWPGILLLSLLAGLGEEMLFRVLLQGGLSQYIGELTALMVASLAFGLMHFLSKLYVFVTFVIGLIFGIAYLLTESFLLVATAHFIYDVCAFAVIVKFPNLIGERVTERVIESSAENRPE